MGWDSGEVRRQVVFTSTSGMTGIVLPWQLLFGVETVRVVDEMRALEGAPSQSVWYRTADVETRTPSSWTQSGSSRTTAGIGVRDIDTSALDDALWIQLALRGKAASGNEAEAYSMIRVMAGHSGRTIGGRAIDYQPTPNSGETRIVSLAAPQKGVTFSELMFGVKVFGVDGTLSYRPVWRTYDDEASSPGAWTDLGSSDQSTTGNETWNSGTLSPTLGTKALWQPGIKLWGSSARATVQALVAAKWG